MQHKIPPGVLIQAYGYDENVMPNGVGLTRDDLDKDFPDNPVMVGHVSMHGAVLNSAAMKKYNITARPRLRRAASSCARPGSNEPSGLTDGNALICRLSRLCRKPTREEEVEWSRARTNALRCQPELPLRRKG